MFRRGQEVEVIRQAAHGCGFDSDSRIIHGGPYKTVAGKTNGTVCDVVPGMEFETKRKQTGYLVRSGYHEIMCKESELKQCEQSHTAVEKNSKAQLPNV